MINTDGICVICGQTAIMNTYFCSIECRQISLERDAEMLKQPMGKKCPIPPIKSYERTLSINLQNDNTIVD